MSGKKEFFLTKEGYEDIKQELDDLINVKRPANIEAIKEASFMGTKLLLTMHGKDIEDISKDFLEGNMFKNIIILTKKQKPGEIKKIYKLEDKNYVISS